MISYRYLWDHKDRDSAGHVDSWNNSRLSRLKNAANPKTLRKAGYQERSAKIKFIFLTGRNSSSRRAPKTTVKKFALFIAGDENIFFPALVAILSTTEHNPDVFDPFMCFDGSKLTNDMQRTLRKYGVEFIDSRKLANFDIENSFKMMTEGKWPIDIFYNYALPAYFHKIGYEYSIKMDYDILCVAPYNLSEITPSKTTISGLCSKVDLVKEGIEERVIATLKESNRLKDRVSDYMNVGFIVFNNQNYVELKAFEVFRDAYNFLAASCPRAKLLEQIAFSVLLHVLGGQHIKLSEAYNHRVLRTRHIDDNLDFDTKNIHYITQFKPWKPIELDKLKWFLYRNSGCLFSYRNIWLDFAEKLPEFEDYCGERKLSETQLIALQMFIVRNYNERINKLEKELKELKA